MMLTQWQQLNCTIGSQLKVMDDNQLIFAGTAIAINEEGAIMVRSEQGEVKSFDFGEISIR